MTKKQRLVDALDSADRSYREYVRNPNRCNRALVELDLALAEAAQHGLT